MKKIISVFVVAIILLSLSPCAFALDLADGIYEVPVTLMHKEDEKESFGNKYVAQTALLEVKNSKKTITILLTTDMKGIEFSYYTNGSLSGDVAKGTPVSNVTAGGEAYKQGFEIPVTADGDIGLQFTVPVMPMSPSARLRIDYASVKLIKSYENKASTDVTKPSPSELTSQDEKTEEALTGKVSEEITTELSTAENLTSEKATEEISEEVFASEKFTEYEADEAVTENSDENQENPQAGSVLPVVCATGIVAVLVGALIIRNKLRREKR